MPLAKSCQAVLLGVGLVLCILAFVFGVDGLIRDSYNQKQHEATKSYNIRRNCTIRAVSEHRSGRGSDMCLYHVYWLSLEDPEETAKITARNGQTETVDIRQAYSNFYEGVCGGFMVNLSTAVGMRIPCWLKTPTSGRRLRVRVSPITPRNHAFLAYGIVLIMVGGTILILFLAYNCFLLAVGCCSNDRSTGGNLAMERGERATRLHRGEVVRGVSLQQTSSPGVRRAVAEDGKFEQHSEPFAVPNADELAQKGQNWKSRFVGNSYAEGVIHGLKKLKRKLRTEKQQEEEKEEEEPKALDEGGSTSNSEDDVDDKENDESVASGIVIATTAVDIEGQEAATPAAFAVPLVSPAESVAGGLIVFVEDCQICFEALSTAVVMFPCGHHICDQCAINLLSHSYSGFVSYIRCPTCRTEHQDSSLLRFALTEDPASGERFYRSGQVSMATSRYTSPVTQVPRETAAGAIGSESPSLAFFHIAIDPPPLAGDDVPATTATRLSRLQQHSLAPY